MNARPAERFRYGEILAVIVVGALLLFVVGRTADLFMLLFIAALLGLYLDAVADLLRHRTRMPRSLALAAAVLLTIAAIAGFILVIAPPVAEQLRALIDTLPAMAERLEAVVDEFAARIPALAGTYHPGEHRVLLALADRLSQFASGAAGRMFGAGPAILATASAGVMGIYFAADPARYEDAFVGLLPPRERGFARTVLGDLAGSMRSWIIGQLINMAILGVMMAVGLKLLGVPYWLAFGAITFVLALVPFFGSLAATVLPALVVLGADRSPGHAVAVVALGLFVHLFEGNVLAPLVMSVQVELPPVVTMFGILLFGALLGPLGVLVAVPAIAAIDVLVQRVLVERIYLSPRFRSDAVPAAAAAPAAPTVPGTTPS
jgi:predicted PurR-regulated permease PerM